VVTIAAEAQAKSGHDFLAMPTWWPHAQADLFEPMNDVVEPLIKLNGEVNGTVKYLGKAEIGHPEDVGRARTLKGILYHYPNPRKHQILSISASPAPPKVARQIYAQATLTKMCGRFYQGEAMEKTLAWAESELEGFMRS
jgi:hypothetical protein